ncbi:MAG: polyprenyl synthetase family protein [Candidatus Omnitrophota bacterium]
MLNKLKITINHELAQFISQLNKDYSLRKISPLLFETIKDFMLRDGKRVRPLLFVAGYLGYAKKPAPRLYQSALSIELLHDFMLIHDDIIDKSNVRRGKPTVHVMLNRYLKNKNNLKFNGQDLAIIVGDIMYAMAIRAFLSINEKMEYKERALKKFIDAAIYTGTGEFIELICGIKSIEKTAKEDIYRIYDYKTAQYTFSSPLATGAILAGADEKQISLLSQYGIYIGRAFQIKDDIIGMFSEEKAIGKSTLSDLAESKKTLLIWYAYNQGNAAHKRQIKNMLQSKNITMKDLLKMRQILTATGALEAAKQEIFNLSSKADKLLKLLTIKPRYKNMLSEFSAKTLKI